MKTYDRVSSLFFVVLAFAICVESIRLGPGSLGNPGTGLIPLGCGFILGIISLIFFTRTFKGLPQAREAFWGAGRKKVEFNFVTCFLDGLWPFAGLLGIYFGYFSLDEFLMPMGWRDGMEGDDFYLRGHHILQLCSLLYDFGNATFPWNFGVLMSRKGLINGRTIQSRVWF